ncbi:hypothetical protein [Niveispirillum sp. KHB5.9]|uniref:hypothetical protein n=1 Tax=Niveispirillum sp. KHB5.9 TaxID=3400269 RepID=UPI003A85D359
MTMMDDEPLDWTLEEHIAAGQKALETIATDTSHTHPEPVCHHFSQLCPVDPMEMSVEETYQHLIPLYAALGVDFLADRLEAWERLRPDNEWLLVRIRALFHAAAASGLSYDGWTWEPRNRQPVGACRFQVINNRTPEL